MEIDAQYDKEERRQKRPASCTENKTKILPGEWQQNREGIQDLGIGLHALRPN
jgi:hypothetical protein